MRDDVRLVTVSGPGGAGKTRVGIEVAGTLLTEFDDGVFFVDLAPLRDHARVVPAIARALGVHDLGAGTVLEKLAAHMRDQCFLLLLDNFEHVLPAGLALPTLLDICPRLKLLVTSRAALHLRGEREYPLSPLALPEPGHFVRPDELSTYSAVALFVQRATDVLPNFTLRDEDAPLVAEICRRLDGLPLAIELAAARIKHLTPPSMLRRLDRCLPFLIGGARDLPHRQQTLRAAISWSYELLSEIERRGFERLAVFAGGCTLEAIAAIGDTDRSSDVSTLDVVASLVDKNLARQVTGRDGTSRYTMLETVREFATERLAATGAEHAVRRRHAEYYMTFAESARAHLRAPDARMWLDRFEAEHDNLRIALAWAEATAERAGPDADADGDVSGSELASRIVQACAWFWMLRGHLRQALATVERLLARASPGTPAHARALVTASGLHHYAGDVATALRRGEEGLAAWRSLGDRSQIAVALARVGEACGRVRQADRAAALLEECETLSGDARHEADLEFPIVFMLAKVASAAGDADAAARLFEQSATLSRAAGDHHTTLGAHRNLALIAQRQGEIERAREHHAEALRLADHLEDYSCMMQALGGLASIALEGRHTARAARLLSAVGCLHERTGMALNVYSRAGNFEQSVAMLREALDDDVFEAAWSEGRAMSLDEAARYALTPDENVPVVTSTPATPSTSSSAFPLLAALTPREREVACQIARGLSNRDIAAVLTIGERTVHVHVASILAKLGCRSRTQVAILLAESRPGRAISG